MSILPTLSVGALLRAQVEGHNEPAQFLPIESTTPMNAGSGVALVVYRGPGDAQIAKLFASVPDLLEALHRIDALSPYSDEVNDAQCIARAAIAKATGA